MGPLEPTFYRMGMQGEGKGRKSLWATNQGVPSRTTFFKGWKIQSQKKGSILEMLCFMSDNTFDIEG